MTGKPSNMYFKSLLSIFLELILVNFINSLFSVSADGNSPNNSAHYLVWADLISTYE